MEATVKIEKRVPVPPTGRTTGLTDALKKMAVGDSFILPIGIAPYSSHAYARAAGVKVTVKKQGKNSYRVWRIK